MPITLDQLAAAITPEKTVLLFGSGSSLPSGAPSTSAIRDKIASHFNINAADLTLAEIASIAEKRRSRRELVETVRTMFVNLKPTGGLLSFPRYPWKNIYTTNYDDLLEQSYKRARVPLSVYSSNFDFRVQNTPEATKLLKLHGTIDKDIADGHQSRWIITETDYDATQEYRESLYDTLKADLAGNYIIIIGHSLADADIRSVIDRAISITTRAFNQGTIFLLLYTESKERAELYENRGLQVCFGGINDFAAALNRKAPASVLVHGDEGDPLDSAPDLRPLTIDVNHYLTAHQPDIAAMFNGWPANYPDIAAGNTFERSAINVAEQHLTAGEKFAAILLGGSGVGKTTTARQMLHRLVGRGFLAWEHQTDHTLLSDSWLSVARSLEKQQKNGVLFVDDADGHLYELNDLFDALAANKLRRLRVVAAAARNRWNPRVKEPSIFAASNTYILEKLDGFEITALLRLVETNDRVAGLVDESFVGFSANQRRRRLEDRCEKDMFVCLRNIFASEKFDDIILREYAQLKPEYRDIYKFVAALESSGVRVHRQLVIRLLGLPMNNIPGVLQNLTDIIHEYTISQKEGIYGWRGRHPVIMGIITDFKFAETESFVELFEKVLVNLVPTYDIEIRTLRELCNLDTGIARVHDRKVQNRLLARMISIAPGERVPRHRLIRNLIDMGEFEKAEAEIRLFAKDFKEDGPVHRYRVRLLLERAVNSPGLLEEDRLVLLDKARELAAVGVGRFRNNKNVLFVYCDVGVEIFKRTGKLEVFDEAITALKTAEHFVGDPDITRQIANYERRVSGSGRPIVAVVN